MTEPNAAFAGDAAIYGATAQARTVAGHLDMPTYEIATEVQLTVTFLDLSGPSPVTANPSDVILFLAQPGQAAQRIHGVTGGLVYEGGAEYSYTFPVLVSGAWAYKWQGLGAVVATSSDATFIVEPSAFIPG